MKAIVLDLDGTLLNTEKQISYRNLQAVIKSFKNGKRIIIATARPPRSVKTFLPEELLEISSFVYYNGALIIDEHAKIYNHTPIKKKFSNDILEYCANYLSRCTVSVEVKDQWMSNKKISDSSIYNHRFQPRVLPIEELKRYEATKILINDFGEIEKFKKLFEDRVKLVITDGGKLIQIMNKGISKEAGIRKLCNFYGISPSELVVFGDDYNDIEMFEMSGYAVAMSNAVQDLKDISDEITDSNDNDGVAKVLEKMI